MEFFGCITHISFKQLGPVEKTSNVFMLEISEVLDTNSYIDNTVIKSFVRNFKFMAWLGLYMAKTQFISFSGLEQKDVNFLLNFFSVGFLGTKAHILSVFLYQ